MKYKALICDLDGTTVPNHPKGMPSSRVKEAVALARQHVKVACATGREVGIASPIIKSLELTSPCIIAGGSQIIDPLTLQPIWQKVLTAEKLREIVQTCREFPYIMGADSDSELDYYIKDYKEFFDKPIVFILNVEKEVAPQILAKLQQVKDINTHAVVAWTEGNVDIHITHKDASKKLALQEWLKIERIEPHEVIAIGDSNNDFPLFEVAGLKIAMGNGTEELKAAADWIAPTVQEDGVAVAVEQFILAEK